MMCSAIGTVNGRKPLRDLEKKIRAGLMARQDKAYHKFVSKLIPSLDPERMIGVRTPELRKYMKELAREENYELFLEALPHHYYEENNLHGAMIEQMKDFEKAMRHTEDFLPYIDNWATCDSFTPKIFKKYPSEVYEKVTVWITSDHTYTIRYAIGVLLSNYLKEEFQPEMLEMVSAVESEEYYVNMMIAWYFSMALVQQYQSAIPYLTERKLSKWVHNKTIQKAVESRQIAPETKEYLRSLRVK